ncbi:MAG: FKBP-type peptidyl-prolyl cis-trans isomerase [Clostridia bacterium]|nr:FKBP-type peptidyl-prolyl cis-trans isomerase [Clostridia bacterium]
MNMKRWTSLLLAALMLLSFTACGETESVTTEDGFFENEELSPTEQAEADEAALKKFVSDYRAGKFNDNLLFQFENPSQYYNLGEYKGISYPDDELLNETVTDEMVDDYITGIQVVGILKEDDLEEVTQGEVQKFDMVTMDYKGLVDGEAMDSTTATDAELLIGSNQFIPGFESGLIGKKIGEETVLDLKFSPYYDAPDVAGKSVQFYVTVKKVQRPKNLVPVTVEEINTLYGSSFKDMEEVKADIRNFLENERSANAYTAKANYVQRALYDSSEVISYPDAEVDFFRRQFIETYTSEMEEGQTVEEFCEEQYGVSYEEFDADALAYGKEMVAASLMLNAVAEKEGITCSDEQLEAMIAGLYSSQGTYYGNMESFITDYTDLYGADYFEQSVISAAAIEFLVENAVKAAQ